MSGSTAFALLCPACGKPNDAATPIQKGAPATPEVGTFMLCWGCAAILVVVDVNPPRARVAEASDDADIAQMPDLARARQFVLEKNRLSRTFRTANSEEALGKLLDDVPEGKIPIQGGLRCSSGPPPRRWRPAEKTRCDRCKTPIWVKRALPGLRVCCAECLTELFIAEGKGLA